MSDTLSAYATSYARFIEAGYSVIPIRPGDKAPGVFKNGQWYNQTDWQRFGDRLPSGFELRIWADWPDAGIGVCLGPASGNLVAIDLDYGSAEIRRAIESCLPPSPVRKVGAKGYTAFYRGDPNMKSKVFRLLDREAGQKVSVCEILCRGRQTVLPPTIHPDTGRPYEWLTPDALDETDVADLPLLPADFPDRIAAAIEPFGYEPEPERVSSQGAYGVGQDGTIWRSLNNTALANLGAWVPELGLHGLRENHGRYEAVATWRPSNKGRPVMQRKPNLKIAPNGIKDFGDDKSYSPLDLVMDASGATLDSAFEWLHRRVIPEAATIVLTPRTAVPPHDPETGELVEDAADPKHEAPGSLAAAVAVAPPSLTDAHTRVPGLLGDMIDWLEATSPTPSRMLCMGVSLTILGALFGRRFSSHPGGGTNPYIVTLADSGFGKSYPMKMGKMLVREAGLGHLIAGAKIKSDSGLRKRIESYGSVFYLLDEFGGHLRQWLGSGARAALHNTNIRDLVMTLFSEADGAYEGEDYGDGETPTIFNPNLCFYGTTTEQDFWRSLESGAMVDGFLPRFILLDAGSNVPDYREPRLPPTAPPALVKALREASGLNGRLGNLSGTVKKSELGLVKPQLRPIVWDDPIKAFFAEFRAALTEERRNADPDHAPIIARIGEHGHKIAVIRALGRDWNKPRIEIADLEWGLSVARHSAEMMIARASDMIANTPHQADYKKVRRMILGAGQGGMSRRDMAQRLSGAIEARKLDDILKSLRNDAQDIVEELVRSGTRGPKKMVLRGVQWSGK